MKNRRRDRRKQSIMLQPEGGTRLPAESGKVLVLDDALRCNKAQCLL